MSDWEWFLVRAFQTAAVVAAASWCGFLEYGYRRWMPAKESR